MTRRPSAGISSSGHGSPSQARAWTATSAPARASSIAIPRPIPRLRPAPVTSATLPSSELTAGPCVRGRPRTPACAGGRWRCPQRGRARGELAPPGAVHRAQPGRLRERWCRLSPRHRRALLLRGRDGGTVVVAVRLESRPQRSVTDDQHSPQPLVVAYPLRAPAPELGPGAACAVRAGCGRSRGHRPTRAAAVTSFDLRARRLEELDRVARRVLEKDLPAARPADDLVAERQAGGP